jgi:5-methylcytosine-specific restriction endonuclease McrA
MPVEPPPSAEAQLAFLAKLQRLFAEGDFTATYKFALLIALADLAVERGTEDGRELALTTREIAERFIQLYWRQAVPYGTGRPGTEPGVLVQNIGAQAAVVSAIAAFRAQTGAANPLQAATHPAYRELLNGVARTVSAQPLNYLQNFGGSTTPFLYDRPGPGAVVLKPGVAYCLRRFQPLVQQLARTQWADHIKANQRNRTILGDAGDLEDFLFCVSRQSLAVIAQGLRRLDGGACFYCGASTTDVDVDHFIPFTLYPRDLAHNFVLTHPTCNRSKSDTLAGRPHLERWLDRLVKRGDALAEIGSEAGVVADATTNHRVASWAYASSAAGGGRAWLAPSSYELINGDYVRILEGASLPGP